MILDLLNRIPAFADLPENTQDLIARLLLFVLALAMIWVLRRVLTAVIVRPVRRLIKRTGQQRDEEILDAVLLPMRYFVIAAALLVSVRILGIGDGVSQFVERIGRSIVIFGIVLLIYRLIDLFAPSSNRLFALTGLSIEERLLPFFRTGIKVVLIAITLVIIIQEWGYDVSGLVAGIGLGGLAISLAAQDTIANLFGFTAIVGDRPFDVGEYIVTPDVEGLVEHVGIRSTRVRRLDQALVTVPNNKLANSAILNWSRLSKRRVDYILGVTYDATSEDMRVLLHRIREMLKARPMVDPESVVAYFINFGDSSLEILVRAFVLLRDWGEFTAEREQINLEVMDIVKDLGMSVAFPTRSIYIENLPDFLLDSRAAPRQPDVEHTRLSPRERAVLREEALKKELPAAEPPPPPTDTQQLGDDGDLPER